MITVFTPALARGQMHGKLSTYDGLAVTRKLARAETNSIAFVAFVSDPEDVAFYYGYLATILQDRANETYQNAADKTQDPLLEAAFR